MTQYKTINSFSQKPSIAQVIAYALYLMQILIFFIIIQNRLASQATKITMIVLISLSFAVHIVITVMTSLSDPSDDFMIQYRNDRESVPQEDLMNMLYCDLCHSYVKQTSRHCRTCGRCVQNFDHHCMWINNCVGGKNYKMFLYMVGFTLLTMCLYIISCILLWSENSFSQFIAQMGIVWASGLLISVFAILICNLIGLHIYLAYLGITTYQFITNARIKQDKKSKMKQQQKTNQTIQISYEQERNKNLQSKMDEVNQVKLGSEEKTIEVVQNKKKTKTKGNSKSKNKIEYGSDHFIHNTIQTKHKINSSEKSQAKLSKIVPVKQNVNYDKQNAKELQQEDEYKSEISDKQSIRISQFFTRNKSLKILVNSDAVKPEKAKNTIYPQTCKNSRQLKKQVLAFPQFK